MESIQLMWNPLRGQQLQHHLNWSISGLYFHRDSESEVRISKFHQWNPHFACLCSTYCWRFKNGLCYIHGSHHYNHMSHMPHTCVQLFIMNKQIVSLMFYHLLHKKRELSCMHHSCMVRSVTTLQRFSVIISYTLRP